MIDVSKAVTALGSEDISRWLVLEESATPSEKELRDRALIDKADVYACDILIRFTDDLSTPTVPSGWATASRFEETGMAEALGKMIIVVGGNQSLFDRLESRIHVPDTRFLYIFLKNLLYASMEEFN
jgi:hypothetical protein